MVAVTPPPVVRVEWVDSDSTDEWTGLEELKRKAARDGGLACFSVGFLLRDDGHSVTIAHSFTLDERGHLDSACGALTIPRVAIAKLRKVKT